jgi:Pyruvate/2-oxoglutarate dehydrogenase complex, dihydrolipoamide acyltransferase (E2) component, and related enzymes
MSTTPIPLTENREVPLSRMRRAIGRAMTASAAIPQFTVERVVSTAALSDQRALFDAADRISFTDQLVAAVSRALVAHPRLNATIVPEDKIIVELASVNIGLAFAVDDGLISPPVMTADRLSLKDLSKARREIGEAVRSGNVSPAALAEVTFTISNLGPFGVDRFTALVVPPQAAILAVSAVNPEGRMSLSLSCDHRVVDGAPAAEYLRDVADALEEPGWMTELETAEESK